MMVMAIGNWSKTNFRPDAETKAQQPTPTPWPIAVLIPMVFPPSIVFFIMRARLAPGVIAPRIQIAVNDSQCDSVKYLCLSKESLNARYWLSYFRGQTLKVLECFDLTTNYEKNQTRRLARYF